MSLSVLFGGSDRRDVHVSLSSPLDSCPTGMEEIAHREGNDDVACGAASKPDVDSPLCECKRGVYPLCKT